ncbi:F-box domain [Arabidopsis suecica]|uniref:F-box domain n=1 Tax=Arabidopsis suecica TaxID=45249 RepID=A0A8T2AH21_ARASU|nr:F-box domain [Arabidopsis suecica]
MPNWSQLPEELLHLTSTHLEDNCFDVVHARSVCTSWRSAFPFPSSLLRPSYSLPSFPLERKDLSTLEKVPLFLFRALTPHVADAVSPFKYYLGGIGQDESEDHMELSFPLQCSVKIKIPGSDPTLMNMLDYQIIPLGHKYRLFTSETHRMAFLPLDKEGRGGEFVVLLTYMYPKYLLVLTSADMRWKQLQNIPIASCFDVVTFRGRFYASFYSNNIFVIDPYSLKVTPLFPKPQNLHYLVPSGNDELFLVEKIISLNADFSKLPCRVSKLDEEAGKWVAVSDLGDRLLFIGGHIGNVSCLAKELPHGCGLSGNSILFTHVSGNVIFPYKYGVHTGNAEDDLNCWRPSMENRVMILNEYFSVLSFQVSKLQQFLTSEVNMATNKKKISSSIMPDWSQLPEELLHLISKNLENYCFDVVHARSVCTSWRSAFPFPLLRQSYPLPSLSLYPSKSKDLCTIEKVPLFLFRVLTPDVADVLSPFEYFFLGGIDQDESDDHMELPSPLQCSVKVKLPGTEPILMNMLDCQIIPVGHKYRMIGQDFIRVAILPLDKEAKRGEFVVILNYSYTLLVLTSAEMRWKPLKNVLGTTCNNLVTFRGRFYATFTSMKTVVIDPYSLEVTLLLPSPENPVHYLVPSGNDELFLVESTFHSSDISQLTYRVSRLDEKAGTWVEVKDLGDRVLFVGNLGKFSCSAKELPRGCGLSGNSILFTDLRGNVIFPYKYGVHTGNPEDDLNCWRPARENSVVILNTSFPVMTLRVER